MSAAAAVINLYVLKYNGSGRLEHVAVCSECLWSCLGISIDDLKRQAAQHVCSRSIVSKSIVGAKKTAWGSLHPNLLEKLEKHLEEQRLLALGTHYPTAEHRARATRQRVLRACHDAGIWPHVAMQLAEELESQFAAPIEARLDQET